MRQIRHPLVEKDIIGIADHILGSTDGDFAAARRRLDEVDRLINSIAENPSSGTRMDGALSGWLVRHGGKGFRLTVVFRFDAERNALLIALVAFGGRNWIEDASGRNVADIW